MREKCKTLLAKIPRDALILTILLLAATTSFGLGYLAGVDAGQGRAEPLVVSPAVESASSTQVIASKFGTKYYLPTCAGVARISPANKVTFASAAAARDAGYAPAGNCAGI